MTTVKFRCFPRLSTALSHRYWMTLVALPLKEISEMADGSTAKGAEFYAVATERCSNSDLLAIRLDIIALAKKHGFPENARFRTKFDQEAAAILHESMQILPADAASNEVWNFINVRLLPDVVIWRYGNQGPAGSWVVSDDRLFHITRTTFGRLWWRAELFGPELARKLGEDEAVQLMERPRISGYAPLATAIIERHLVSSITSNRMDLLRSAMKIFRRKLAVFSIFTMDDVQIQEFVDSVFSTAESNHRTKADLN